MTEAAMSESRWDRLAGEVQRGFNKFGEYKSLHEAVAVIREELDELWDEVKGKQRTEQLRKEALHVAATAFRMYEELAWGLAKKSAIYA
jgi:hypothetical protein